MSAHRADARFEWEEPRPGRVLVRDQLEHAKLSVPTVSAAYGDGPPRLEWSDADPPVREIAVDALLWDLQRLGRAETTDEQIIRTARKYGPLRIRRCGIPGTVAAEDVLSASERRWEDPKAQIRWADTLLGLAIPEEALTEDDIWDDGSLARWEPLAAWRTYGRVLRAVLGIAADLVAGKGVMLTEFADAWSPALQLLPIIPSREGLPHAPKPFDAANPMDWEVSEYARAWWKEIDLSLTAFENRLLTAKRALSWTLDGLAVSAGLRVHLVWPEVATTARKTTATPLAHAETQQVPSYILAPIPSARYPTEVPVYASEIVWSVWAVAVAQLHAAVTSTRDRVECDRCDVTFDLIGGKRRPRPGDPAYCGDECRREGENLRRRSRTTKKAKEYRQVDRSFDRSS